MLLIIRIFFWKLSRVQISTENLGNAEYSLITFTTYYSQNHACIIDACLVTNKARQSKFLVSHHCLHILSLLPFWCATLSYLHVILKRSFPFVNVHLQAGSLQHIINDHPPTLNLESGRWETRNLRCLCQHNWAFIYETKKSGFELSATLWPTAQLISR